MPRSSDAYASASIGSIFSQFFCLARIRLLSACRRMNWSHLRLWRTRRNFLGNICATIRCPPGGGHELCIQYEQRGGETRVYTWEAHYKFPKVLDPGRGQLQQHCSAYYCHCCRGKQELNEGVQVGELYPNISSNILKSTLNAFRIYCKCTSNII
jgi:hypothetical protein